MILVRSVCLQLDSRPRSPTQPLISCLHSGGCKSTECPFKHTLLHGKEIQTWNRKKGSTHWYPVCFTGLVLWPLPVISLSNLVIYNLSFNSAICEPPVMSIWIHLLKSPKVLHIFAFSYLHSELKWDELFPNAWRRLGQILWITALLSFCNSK